MSEDNRTQNARIMNKLGMDITSMAKAAARDTEAFLDCVNGAINQLMNEITTPENHKLLMRFANQYADKVKLHIARQEEILDRGSELVAGAIVDLDLFDDVVRIHTEESPAAVPHPENLGDNVCGIVLDRENRIAKVMDADEVRELIGKIGKKNE